MPYDHDYVCMMKEPVVCELCNKSYAIGRMKAHKQTKMHKENALRTHFNAPTTNQGVNCKYCALKCGRMTHGPGEVNCKCWCTSTSICYRACIMCFKHAYDSP